MPLWRAWVFLLPCRLLYSVLKEGILLWYTYCDLENNARSLCSIWSYFHSSFSPFWKGKTRLPCCLSGRVWFSFFSLWWRKTELILLLVVPTYLCIRFSLPLTIALMLQTVTQTVTQPVREAAVWIIICGSKWEKVWSLQNLKLSTHQVNSAIDSMFNVITDWWFFFQFVVAEEILAESLQVALLA